MLNRLDHVRRRTFRVISYALIAASMSACGGGGADVIVDAGSMNITLPAASGSMTAGSSSTFTVSIARTGSFTGAVDLSIEGLPTGVTATVTPAQLASGVSTATVNVTAAASAALATTTLTVRAKASGQADKTASFALTITAAAATGAFTLSLAPTTLSIVAGANSTSTVTIARTGTFTGPVNLAISGLPAGVTATLSDATVTGTSSTITVSVAAGTAASSGTISITGTGTGVANQTVSLGVTTTVAATGSFSLSLAPATLSIAAGASNTSTVTIARTAPFTGAVNLSVSGAPAGVTASLSSTSVTGTTATLTVAVAAGTAASTGTITVTGTAAGVTNATAALGLTTTAGAVGTGNIVFRFCEAPFPVWLAVQDGTGAWTRVTGTNNTFSFDINSATGGVAYATTSGTTANTSIYYGTKAEITARGIYNCPTATGKTITGSATGLTALDQGFITLGNKSTVLAGGVSTFTLNGVPDGARDLVATKSTLNPQTFSSAVTRIIIRRALNPAAGSALAALDFNSEGFVPGTATATINNLGGDASIMTGLFTTANGTNGVLYADIGTGGASRTFSGVPASQTIAGDVGFIQATALPPGYLTDPLLAATSRSAGIFFATLGNQTLTLGPALSTPTVSTVGTAPYVRLRNVLQRQAEYNKFFYVTYQQSGANPRNVVIEATGEYLGNGPFDVTIPDFTSAGYDAGWGLKTAVNTIWVNNVSGWSAGAGVAAPTAGVTTLNAAKAGQLTP